MAEFAVIEEGATFSESELLTKTALQYLSGAVATVVKLVRRCFGGLSYATEDELLEKTVLKYLPGTVDAVLTRLREEPQDICDVAQAYLHKKKIDGESALALAKRVHGYFIKGKAYEVKNERGDVMGWQANGIAVDDVVNSIERENRYFLLHFSARMAGVDEEKWKLYRSISKEAWNGHRLDEIMDMEFSELERIQKEHKNNSLPKKDYTACPQLLQRCASSSSSYVVVTS